MAQVLAVIDQCVLWIERRLDAGGWFRRGFLIVATLATWQTMLWSFAYANMHAERPGIDVAAVIGAVTAVPGALVTFAFKWYLESRKPNE